MIQLRECPRCGCPYWKISSSSCGPTSGPHKDEFGDWHTGAELTDVIYECGACKWSYSVKKKFGRAVSSTLSTQLQDLLGGWASEEQLFHMLNPPEGIRIKDLVLDRHKGVVDVHLRLPLTEERKT